MKNKTLWTLKLIVTILILTYIFSRIPISSIWETLVSVEGSAFLLLIPIILFSSLISAGQLKVFTDNHHMQVSLSRILSINVSTEFYNLFLPSFLAGGAIRWHKLSQENKKRAEAFTALILNRLVNTLTLTFFGFICWQHENTSVANDSFGLFFLLLWLGLLGVYIFLFSQYLPTTFKAISVRPYFRLLPKLISNGLSKLMHAANDYQKLSFREHSTILLLSCFWQVLGILFFFLLAQSLSIQMSLESLGWIRSLLGLLLLFPISISGFGVREGGLLFFFGYYGITPQVAIAFSFLLFARTLLLGLIGAALETKGVFIPVRQEALK